MGIEINPEARVPRRGALRRRPSRDRVLAELQKAVMGAVADPLLAKAIRAEVHEHTLFVALHPCAPQLEFTWSPEGTVTASCKTSTVGPGFHAYCIELLEAAGEACALRWNWADADDTEYAITRDFARLQQSMIKHLLSLGSMLTDPSQTAGMENIAIHWPIDRPLPVDRHFTVTPSGPRDLEWWQRLMCAGPEELAKMAADFFPWWGRGRDAQFCLGLLTSLLWSEVAWHPPLDDLERTLCHLALKSADRARELDSSASLPLEEIEELRRMAQATPEHTTPPGSTGIGFRRRLMRFRASGGWSVELPGYFYEQADDNGTVLYWFGQRNLRLTTFTVAKHDGSHPDAAELLEHHRLNTPVGADVVEFSNDRIAGHATVRPSQEDGTEFTMLQGCVATDGTFAMVTVCFQNHSDRAWAEAAFRSVKAPPAEQSQGEEDT